MAKFQRKRMSKKSSRRDFRAKSHPHNLNNARPTGTMRGGIRL